MKLKFITNGWLQDTLTGKCYSPDATETIQWLAAGNTPEPQFTPAEILANTKAKTNADALAAIAVLMVPAIEAMLSVVERLGLPAEKAILTPMKIAVAAERAKIVP